ncbi:MAG: SH3 domain-containing protein [Gemmatimonadaceae bacterium]
MRSVRCDSCGMKAMLAASQCPHCGHLFELRDGFGESLPLAHCGSCDSYYPLRQGSCRWCGTKPEGFRIAPYAVKGVGALVFAGLVAAAWLTNRDDSEAEPPTVVVNKPAETTVTINVDSGVDFQAPVFAGIEDTLSGQPTTVAVDLPVLESAPPALDPAQPMPAVDSTPLPAPAVVAVRSAAPTKVAPRSSPSVRWVRATARKWVTVRASATHKSRIVAAIGPDTRVQLGESQGDWRRIRTKGISGWVERGKF